MAIGNVAAGQVYQAGQTVLKKLTGQLLGNQSGDTGKTPMTIEVIGGGKTAKPPAEETKSLCFPSDLLTDNPAEGNHGHYIQFFINTQEESKITFGDAQRKNITDEIYIGSRLHSNPGQKDANISSGIIPGPRRQINIGLEYSF